MPADNKLSTVIDIKTQGSYKPVDPPQSDWSGGGGSTGGDEMQRQIDQATSDIRKLTIGYFAIAAFLLAAISGSHLLLSAGIVQVRSDIADVRVAQARGEGKIDAVSGKTDDVIKRLDRIIEAPKSPPK